MATTEVKEKFVHLSELEVNELDKKRYTIKNYAIKTEEGTPIGTVQDLILDIDDKDVAFIIGDFSPIIDANDQDQVNSRLAKIANNTSVNNQLNTRRLIPSGIVEIDSESKSISISRKQAMNIVRYTNYDKNATINLETIKQFSTDVVGINPTKGITIFSNSYIQDSNRKNRLFHNHYFSIKF